ncbi:MAG: restriction endonuclease [Oscillospiraceae bacterium]|nr:restriction endonuclease [Oscillospiraceae bacterium]
MPKKDDAKAILSALNMPPAQQSDICCYALLAMGSITNQIEWASSKNDWIRIHDIMQFIDLSFGVRYAENSRETFRKQAIHHFRNAAIIEDNGKATNSPNYRYRLTDEFLKMVKKYGSDEWNNLLENFFKNHPSLMEIYASKKRMTKMPVQINGEEMSFSTGKHNQLQKLILEEFAPRFAPYSECLYVGDTAEKDLYKNTAKLQQLGFAITLHDKMPDMVLYRSDKNWLYFIEAVTSVGPMNAKRITEIEAMTKKVVSGKIYVTAFLDFKTFKSFSESLAWETEVWIADLPEHMIHMNGDNFIGPR